MSRLTTQLAGLALIVCASAAAAITPANSDNPASKAIHGYDSVAYFTENRPVMGVPEYTYAWQGATWYFASAGNRDTFAANPDQWAPRYGGWCAYGMAKGYAANIDPEAFTILDGVLYLNYSRKIMKKWKKKMTQYIEQADANYPRLVEED